MPPRDLAIDRHFAEPRLARIYDAMHPPGPEDFFYLGLARPGDRVLELGCGTGRLATAFAARGHEVVGLDAAPAMLEVARRRDGGERVDWIEGDLRTARLEQRFDLIVTTGHVFQVLLSDDDVATALAAMRRHLAPGGRVTFETRNPLAREWEEWVPDQSHERVEPADGDPFETWVELVSVEGELVRFAMCYRFGDDGVELRAPSTLRFMPHDALMRQLAAAELKPSAIHGDFDGRPFDERTSREIVVVAGAG